MKKEMITAAMLSLAVGLIAIGVHTNNLLIVLLGGFTCGVYNGFIKKVEL